MSPSFKWKNEFQYVNKMLFKKEVISLFIIMVIIVILIEGWKTVNWNSNIWHKSIQFSANGKVSLFPD